jgi:hypothetical protein
VFQIGEFIDFPTGNKIWMERFEDMTEKSIESAPGAVEDADGVHYQYLVKSCRRNAYREIIKKSLTNYPGKGDSASRGCCSPDGIREQPLPVSGTFLILGDRKQDIHWIDKTALNVEFDHMAEVGFDTLFVLTGVSDHVCYPSEIIPHDDREDLLELVLTAAAKHGIQVFVGVPNLLIDWMIATPAELEEVARKTGSLASEIARRYHQYKSFHGWYLPYELSNVFIEESMEEQLLPRWIAALAEQCRRAAAGKPVAIAPYFTTNGDLGRFQALWEMVVQVVKPDIMAMQDGVGIYGEDRLRELDLYFALFRRICAKSEVTLWADMEIFEQFSGVPIDENAWKAQPARCSRIENQILILSRYVERIVMFSFSHYMSPLCPGHADELYQSYKRWRENG